MERTITSAYGMNTSSVVYDQPHVPVSIAQRVRTCSLPMRVNTSYGVDRSSDVEYERPDSPLSAENGLGYSTQFSANPSYQKSLLPYSRRNSNDSEGDYSMPLAQAKNSPLKTAAKKAIFAAVILGVTVSMIVSLAALILTTYTLSGKLNDLQMENRKLSEQVQTTTEQLTRVMQAVTNNTNTLSNTVVNITRNETISLVVDRRLDYHNCTTERASCGIGGPGLVDSYYFQCFTDPPLDINREGYYNTDIRCEYSSNAGYFAATHLQYATFTVVCFCDLIYPNHATGQLNQIPTSVGFSCNLVIDRCPIT